MMFRRKRSSENVFLGGGTDIALLILRRIHEGNEEKKKNDFNISISMKNYKENTSHRYESIIRRY